MGLSAAWLSVGPCTASAESKTADEPAFFPANPAHPANRELPFNRHALRTYLPSPILLTLVQRVRPMVLASPVLPGSPTMAHDVQDAPGFSTCVVAEPTDRDLLEGLRTGDQVAPRLIPPLRETLQQLIRRSAPPPGRRLDADDIMQSVFYAFFQGATDGCYNVPPGKLWPCYW